MHTSVRISDASPVGSGKNDAGLADVSSEMRCVRASQFSQCPSRIQFAVSFLRPEQSKLVCSIEIFIGISPSDSIRSDQKLSKLAFREGSKFPSGAKGQWGMNPPSL